jgi:hypothetical protein
MPPCGRAPQVGRRRDPPRHDPPETTGAGAVVAVDGAVAGGADGRESRFRDRCPRRDLSRCAAEGSGVAARRVVCRFALGVPVTCAAAVDVWPENPRAARAVKATASTTVPAARARLNRRNLRSAASRAATAGGVRSGLVMAANLAVSG